MKTYLVGGAVRDKLLGIPVVDNDWVVVGATPHTMLDAGFVPVGKDFPVFLHPETHEEYALARTERKTGPGYQGFAFNTDSSVTLEEDLLRRDLTINAIAQDDNESLIDPFHGQQDIQDRLLRHVSLAFAEDPVRVLRVAKFMARFSSLGFNIHNDTLALMQSMVASGEVDNLVAERVWQELEASLGADNPRAFFASLMRCGALNQVMPELNDAFARSAAVGSDQSSQPMLNTLDKACTLSTEARVRFASLRLRVPTSFSELALLGARFADVAHDANALTASELHSLLKSLDVARRPERFEDFLCVIKAHAQPIANDNTYAQAEHLRSCATAMGSINAAMIAKSEPNKAQISTVIKQHETAAIENYLKST
ncbi:UNVERIFIED_CONTAM: hypothetical protein GTU68_064761 [Idotea baltica]|nr:hypothetical protein [Idotea baltica]